MSLSGARWLTVVAAYVRQTKVSFPDAALRKRVGSRRSPWGRLLIGQLPHSLAQNRSSEGPHWMRNLRHCTLMSPVKCLPHD